MTRSALLSGLPRAGVGLCALLVAGGFITRSDAASILEPGDAIIAIDLDALPPSSGYPAGENPGLAVDQNSGTKYLNTAGANTGLIVTPAFGSSTIRSFIITTANDAEPRDPSSFRLFGTNDAITSPDNSRGDLESWTEIASGGLTLPAARLTAGTPVDFGNALAFSSYKVLFPTLKGGPLMQIADIQLYTGLGGTGTGVLAGGDSARAVHDPTGSQSSYPGGESPPNAIDANTGTKYLNFGEVNSGFIVTPGKGPSVVRSFQITTANDSPVRDPSAWELFGTNDSIMSADNSFGDQENWTLIDSGTVDLPTDRLTLGPEVAVDNNSAFDSYRLVFTGVRDAAAANSMQIADIQFFGDIVPEPSTSLFLLAGSAFLAGLRRRR